MIPLTATSMRPDAVESADLLYLREADVKALISPAEICRIVTDLAWRDDLQPGFIADGYSANLSLGVKAGFVGEHAFGIKVRAGQEGNYLSVVWDDGGKLRGVVESAYLTYLRTATLMMLLPARHGVPVSRILVLGTGRLGSACCLIADQLYFGAQVRVWSPSGNGPRVAWAALDDTRIRPWQPEPGRVDAFDLVVTATRSTEPLPLDGVMARYVSVGGACRPTRRELPDWLVTSAGQICSDGPAIAGEMCGDLQGLDPQEIGPILSFRATAPTGWTTITFVCGTGAIDVGLALAVCDRARAARLGDHA